MLLPCKLVEDIQNAWFNGYITILLLTRMPKTWYWYFIKRMMDAIWVLRAYGIPMYVAATTAALYPFERPLASNLVLNSLAVTFFASMDDLLGQFLVFPEYWEKSNAFVKEKLMITNEDGAERHIDPREHMDRVSSFQRPPACAQSHAGPGKSLWSRGPTL